MLCKDSSPAGLATCLGHFRPALRATAGLFCRMLNGQNKHLGPNSFTVFSQGELAYEINILGNILSREKSEGINVLIFRSLLQIHPLSDLAVKCLNGVSLLHTVEVICSGSYLHKSELNEDAFRLDIPFTRSLISSQLLANPKNLYAISREPKESVTSTQTSLIIV